MDRGWHAGVYYSSGWLLIGVVKIERHCSGTGMLFDKWTCVAFQRGTHASAAFGPAPADDAMAGRSLSVRAQAQA